MSGGCYGEVGRERERERERVAGVQKVVCVFVTDLSLKVSRACSPMP